MTTTKTTIDKDALNDSLDCRQLAAQYTDLSTNGSTAAGPCPICKGHDRFVVYADRWLCRKCRPDYDTAIGLVMFAEGLDFLTAAEKLDPTGRYSTAAPVVGVKPNSRPPTTPPATPSRQPKPKGKIDWSKPVAVYDYPDQYGDKYLRIKRFAVKDSTGSPIDKTFRAYHWDGKKWKKGKGGQAPILYNLKTVVETAPDVPILLCEGEKDADNLAALSFVATTNPYGSKEWESTFTNILAGKFVVILEDHDEPGRIRTGSIAPKLFEAGCRVKVITPARGGWNQTDAEDVSDTITQWRQMGVADHEITARLNNVITNAPDWSSPEPELLKFTGSTWADLAKVIGPVEWEWSKWLAKGFQTVVAGLSGDGKSNLILHIARSYLTGCNWPDGTPYSGSMGRVLWCETEAAQGLNLERAQLWGLPIDRMTSPLNDPLEDVDLDNFDHRAAIVAAANRSGVGLVVIDSLSGGTRKDSRRASEMLAVGKWIAQLARDTNKPVIVSHHLRKRGLFDKDRVDLDRLRDSSAIVQTARLVWAIDCPDADEPDHKRFYVIKSNLARFPDQDLGFRVFDTGLAFGDAPAPPKQESQLDRAKDLLITLLSKEPRSYHTIKAEAEAAAISIATIRRAKEKMRINVIKNAAGWFWSLPKKDKDIN